MYCMYLYSATAILVGCAGWARLLEGTWAAPGAFYALIWLVASIPAVIILPHDVSPTAMLLVSSFVIAVLVGSQLGRSDGFQDQSQDVAHYYVNAGQCRRRRFLTLTIMVLLLGACGIGAGVGYVWGAGYSLVELLHSRTWIMMAVKYSVARYNQGYEAPTVVNMLTAANYAGGMVAGVALAVRHGVLRRIALSLPVVAGVLITIITTAKSPMIITFLGTFAGWLSARVAVSGGSDRQGRRSWKRIFVVGGILFGGAALVLESLVLRYGPGGASLELITQRIGGYVFGQMAALSAWLSTTDWSGLSPRWGELTFSGLAATLHIHSRIPGLYSTIDLNGWAGQSNVFTALRGLVLDFGFIGAWSVAAFVGAIGGRCYQRLRDGVGRSKSLMALMVFYICAAWSPVISIFDYNVILLAIVIASVAVAGGWREISSGMTRDLLVTRSSKVRKMEPT